MFSRSKIYLLWEAHPALLDGLLCICPCQEHDRVELGVVQLVHGVRRDVQQGVQPPLHDLPDSGQADNARLLLAANTATCILL